MGKAGEEEDTDKGRSDFGKKENKQQDELGAYKESKNEGYKNDKTWKPGDSTEGPAEELTENCGGTSDAEDGFEDEHDNQEAEAM